jgi:SAM-dependent methyltransferase
MWSDTLLLWIFRRFPPKETIFKAPEGRPAEEYALEATRPFYRWFGVGPQQLFGQKDVLDLGSGFGGTAVRYLEYGARTVTGVEISDQLVAHSQGFAVERGVGDRVTFSLGTGEAIPCDAEAFDLVTMYDVLEHVVSPAAVFAECYRVLRPGGTFAAVFPPYYSLWGGSHLHGYATSFPGLNLLFGTRALRSAATLLLDESGYDYRSYLREVPTDKLWNQNGLTVRGFNRLVEASPFRRLDVRYIGERDRRTTRKDAVTVRLLMPAFLAFELAAQLPLVREALCSRVCALLQKPS